ncbi:hypothetical protein SGLAM104S_02500 [Streptomyces glaucescens]
MFDECGYAGVRGINRILGRAEVTAGALYFHLKSEGLAVVAMLADGQGGSIVNTSSVAGVPAPGSGAPYVAAKHAVLGLTRAAAADYGERGIRVNALVVGSVRTELMDEVLGEDPQLEEPFVRRAPQRRMAAPREVAEAAAWLLAGRASFVTGAAMAVDGGWTAA